MARTIDSTPKVDGFRMPGEFEPHQGCWILWPSRTDTWRNGGKPAQRSFVEAAVAISRFEPVTVAVDQHQYLNARQRLPGHIRVVEMSQNDSWIRDTGPTFVVNDQGLVRGVDWRFNAYGGLSGGVYFPWDQDELIARKVLEIEGLDRYRAPLVLEGGSVHVDGQGTLITTEECLLNQNRNPDLDRRQIESYLDEYLNVEKVIWLPEGIYEDETNGHVDNMCCFARPGEVLLAWTDDRQDPQYERSRQAFEILSHAKDARGRNLLVHRLPLPGPHFLTKEECSGFDLVENAKTRRPGDRLACSYINFYLANGGLIMPLFDDPLDEQAVRKLEEVFPDREVTGLPSREIVIGGGNIHCITQQQPLGR